MKSIDQNKAFILRLIFDKRTLTFITLLSLIAVLHQFYKEKQRARLKR